MPQSSAGKCQLLKGWRSDWKALKPCLISVGKSRGQDQTSRCRNKNTWDGAELLGLSGPVSQGSVLGTHRFVWLSVALLAANPPAGPTQPWGERDGQHPLPALRFGGTLCKTTSAVGFPRMMFQQKLLLIERSKS